VARSAPNRQPCDWSKPARAPRRDNGIEEGRGGGHASESINRHRSAVASARTSNKTIAEFLELAAAIVHFRYDRAAERTTLVPRPRHAHQVREGKVVAARMIHRAYQAKDPAAVPQPASVPVPAAVEEPLETNQALVSAADLFG